MGDIRKKPTLTAPDSMSLLTLAGLFVLCSLGASALADDPGTCRKTNRHCLCMFVILA